MRVLFFASDISIQSGASHALLLTASRLRTRGIEVSLAVPDTEACRAFFADFDGKVLFLRVKRPRRTLNPVKFAVCAWSCFKTTIALFRIVRSQHVDVLHLNEITDIFFGLAALFAGIPCVCHVRTDGLTNPYRAVLVGLLRIVADRVIVPSVSTRNWLVKRSGVLNARMTIIYDCAFDLISYDPKVSGAGFRRELGIRENTPLVLLVSKLQIAKGHLCFMQAAKEVAARLPQVRFVVVGGVVNGHEREAAAIRKAAEPGQEKGYLQMVNVLPDLTGALAAADIVVHCPVYPDPYPTVLLLGMAMQKALVASNIGGIPEQVEDQLSGLLFPAGDSNALACLLIDLIGDPQKRRALGLEARRRVRAICNPARQVDQVLEQYHSVLGVPAEPPQSRTAARSAL